MSTSNSAVNILGLTSTLFHDYRDSSLPSTNNTNEQTFLGEEAGGNMKQELLKSEDNSENDSKEEIIERKAHNEQPCKCEFTLEDNLELNNIIDHGSLEEEEEKKEENSLEGTEKEEELENDNEIEDDGSSSDLSD